MKLHLITLIAVLSRLRSQAATPVRITVLPGKVRQEFLRLGYGAMFFEGHITSLAARG